jgi:hypothetical protein
LCLEDGRRTPFATNGGDDVKKKSLKLRLNRETLLNLNPAEDLKKIKIQGGSAYPCTGSCVIACITPQYTGRWCA